MSAGRRKPGDEQGEPGQNAGEPGAVIEPGTFRIERLLPGPIERIWDYLWDGEKRGEWFASGAMPPRTGESFDMYFKHSPCRRIRHRRRKNSSRWTRRGTTRAMSFWLVNRRTGWSSASSPMRARLRKWNSA